MKKKYLIIAFAVIVSPKFLFAQDANKSVLKTLLVGYYTIESDLVQSNSKAVAVHAGEFLKTVNNADMKAAPVAEMKKFMQLQKKLTDDATYMSKSTDLAYQRIRFAIFSTNFYQLAKAIKISDKPIYYDYCPMKKSYWLAADEGIKNPYYDSPMQDCGMVSETFNN
ncbi:MAG: hypothetical protein JWR50_4307 [Mucilaginibacter sp.]|nr:hypothetical protein [Mucilaginibacter sp.]